MTAGEQVVGVGTPRAGRRPVVLVPRSTVCEACLTDTDFGFAAHSGENDTEKQEWKRFHAGKSVSDRWDERRREMTEVEMIGGLAGDGPSRDDLLVIRASNRDGVCTEKVVAFDPGPDRQQIREDVAKHLWVSDGADPELWDKLADRAWGIGGAKLEGATERDKFLAAADQVLAIAYQEGN